MPGQAPGGGAPGQGDQGQAPQASGSQPDYTKAWEEYYKKMGMGKLDQRRLYFEYYLKTTGFLYLGEWSIARATFSSIN